MQISPDSSTYVFVLPSSGVLGSSEDHYEQLEIRKYDIDQNQIELGKVEIFSSGRLGALTGGLLHLQDLRKVVSAEDLAQVQNQHVQDQIAESRP